MQDRVIIAYKYPAICDQKELQEFISPLLKEKNQLCKSDDRYKELDDLNEEILNGDYQTCPKPSQLNSYYQSFYPKMHFYLVPKKPV